MDYRVTTYSGCEHKQANPAGGVPDVAAAAGENPGYRIVLAGIEKVTSGTTYRTLVEQTKQQVQS